MKKLFFSVLLILCLFSHNTKAYFMQQYLVAYWSFDDSTANDMSGHGYNGTIVNSPTFVTGHAGTGLAMHFVGNGDYISASGNNSLIGDHVVLPYINFSAMSEFTITLWVKEEGLSAIGGEAYLWFGHHAEGWLGIINSYIYDPSINQLHECFTVGGTLNINTFYNYTFNFSDRNTWIFYTMVYQNNYLYVYKNAQYLGNIYRNVNINGTRSGLACHWWYYPDERKSARFTGSIDEVMIYNTALTQCQILKLYDSTNYTQQPLSISGSNIQCSGQSVTLQTTQNFSHYSWSSGDTTRAITVSDTGLYRVVVTLSNGCLDSTQFFVHRDYGLTSFSISSILCRGDSVALTTNNNYSSYTWSTGATSSTIFVNDSGYYSLIALDSNGCQFNYSFHVNYISPLQIVGNHSFCKGDSIILTTSKNCVSYNWSTGKTTNAIYVKDSGTYSLTATDSNWCRQTANFQVNMFSPNVSILGDNVICKNDSTILYTKKKFLFYIWSTGDTTSSIVVRDSGNYQLKVVDSNGCTAVSKIYVGLYSPKKLQINGLTQFCKGDTAKLTASSGFNNYKWSVGDSTQEITITDSGMYYLTATDSNGCKSQDSIYINVFAVPNINIIGNNEICQGDSAILSSDKNYSSYHWSTGDTTNEITVKDSGLYSLKITDSNGCTAISDFYLKVFPKANVEILGENQICLGDSTILTPNGDFENYKWSTGDTTRSIIAKDSGIYTLSVINQDGCKGEATFKLNISNQLKINILGNNLICRGDSTVLTADDEYYSYKWSTGDSSKSIIVKDTGIYTLNVQNQSGCKGNNSFYVGFEPFIPFQVIGNKEICQGDSTILFTDRKFIKYDWSSGSTKDTTTIFQGGQYSVNVVDSNGCKDSLSFSINTYPKPTPSLNFDYHSLCLGDSGIIKVNPNYYSDYKWYKEPDSLICSGYDSICVKTNSKYFVEVTDSNGCKGCSNFISVDLTPQKDRLEIESVNQQTIDFGDVNLMNMGCKYIKIKNISDSVVIFNSCYLNKNLEFSIPQSQLPIILNPGDEKELQICFKANNLGEQFDTLNIMDICSIKEIYLKCDGIPNYYNENTNCANELKLTTIGSAEGMKFLTTAPVPNPANEIIRMNYLISDNNSESFLKAMIFNELGELITNGIINNIRSSSIDGATIETGEIDFDLNNLSSGTYFIYVSFMGECNIYPVSICK